MNNKHSLGTSSYRTSHSILNVCKYTKATRLQKSIFYSQINSEESPYDRNLKSFSNAY